MLGEDLVDDECHCSQALSGGCDKFDELRAPAGDAGGGIAKLGDSMGDCFLAECGGLGLGLGLGLGGGPFFSETAIRKSIIENP